MAHKDNVSQSLARFVRVYERPYTDYTLERHKWQKGLTVEQILADGKALRKSA